MLCSALITTPTLYFVLNTKRFRKSLNVVVSSIETGRRELLRGRPRHVVVLSVRPHEEVDAQFLDGPPVHLGKPHLQHHLLALLAARQLQHVDDLDLRGARLRDLAGPQHHRGARDAPGQDEASSFERGRDVLAGEQRLQLLLQRRDAGFDDDVVLRAAPSTPQMIRLTVPAPCRRSGSRAADHDGVGDGRVGDGDARDVEIRRQHGRAPGREHDALEGRRDAAALAPGAASGDAQEPGADATPAKSSSNETSRRAA